MKVGLDFKDIIKINWFMQHTRQSVGNDVYEPTQGCNFW